MLIPTLVGVVIIEAVALCLVILLGEAEETLVVSAFLGAFFPFLFIIAWETARRFRERRTKAHNALVELDLVANKVVSTGASNLYQMEMAIRNKSAIESGKIPMFELKRIPELPFRIILDFLSTDLINRSFRLNADIEVLNSDIEQFHREYREVISLVFRKPPVFAQHPEFVERYDRVHERLGMLQQALLGMLEFCIEVGAQSRVLRNSAESKWSIAKILRAPDDEDQAARVVEEVEEFRGEIRKSRKFPTLIEKGEGADRDFWIPIEDR